MSWVATGESAARGWCLEPGAQRDSPHLWMGEGLGRQGGTFSTSPTKGGIKKGVTEHPLLLLQGQVRQVLCGRQLSLALASRRTQQVKESETKPGTVSITRSFRELCCAVESGGGAAVMCALGTEANSVTGEVCVLTGTAQQRVKARAERG